MAVDHYENFPVASWLLPAPLRHPVRVIYRFARTADDIADEGDAAAQARLDELARLRAVLASLEAGNYPMQGAAWSDLAAVIISHRLPITLFRDLLSAFEQDARGTVYRDDAQLLDYCRRSADPVGRLMLHLYRRHEPDLLPLADQICTGLQLVNFWQDVALDRDKGRSYLPADVLDRFGIREADVAVGRLTPQWTAMMRERTAMARACLLRGQGLCTRLGGRIGWELRFVVQGGLHIARRIDACSGDVFGHRPTLGGRDVIGLALRAARMP